MSRSRFSGMISKDGDLYVSIRVLGDEAVGKSMFISSFEGGENRVYDGAARPDVSKFTTYEDPEKPGLHFNISINLWDTPKWIRWDDSDATVYPSNLEGIIVMFDLTNPISWANVQSKWLPWIERAKQQEGIDRLPRDIALLLVGNKRDLSNRAVEEEEVQKMIQSPKSKFIGYMETNSLNGDNVASAVTLLAQHLACNKKKSIQSRLSTMISEEEEELNIINTQQLCPVCTLL